MAKTTNLTDHILRDVQRELADMRDERIVMTAMLERFDVSLSTFNAELRALRSQFDRFRTEVREDLRTIRELLEKEVSHVS